VAAIVFRNAALFDGRSSRLLPHRSVALEAGMITQVVAGAPSLIRGPRLCPTSRFTMTGGPGDTRDQRDSRIASCCRRLQDRFAAIAAGADAVRKAVRKALRSEAAAHLNLFVSGSVLFPTRALGSTRFSKAEVRAAVEEADRNDLPAASPAQLDGVCS
jgi:imidazolonepropionase-like amidohydrolase